jgi:TonB family protein
MDRESRHTYISRGIALVVTVLVHGLIIFYVLWASVITKDVASPQSIQVTLIDKPPGLSHDWTLPEMKLSRLKHLPLLLSMPHVPVDVLPQPPPPQALASEQTADSSATIVASNGETSSESGTSNSGGGDIAVAHRVQPIYPPASALANEQGYVTVALLIDEHGYVRKVRVVKSSGFSRLDQSVVDALRQWTFTRHADGSPPIPKWTQLAYGFHLASSDALDLSLTLVPYDSAVAEQIRAAAAPKVAGHIPTPYGPDELRRLVSTILAVAPAVGRDYRGSLPPNQSVIKKLGEVQSIRFLGIESRGFNANEVNQVVAPNYHNSPESQWELYKVTQRRGASVWLIDVTREGAIRNAQAMTCAPPQDAVIGCP